MDWMEEKRIYAISFTFTLVIFLLSLQDIAVDGWALEILKKENHSFQASCQAVGMKIGMFMSTTVFLAFSSVDFCNKYIFREK